MLIFADWLLHFLHAAIIYLNVFGWMWAKTRKFSLISLGVSAFCWTVLGFVYHYGYSPLTALHWKIKAAAGAKNLPDSYFYYLSHTVAGLKLSADFIEGMASGVLVMCIISAVFVQLRSRMG